MFAVVKLRSQKVSRALLDVGSKPLFVCLLFAVFTAGIYVFISWMVTRHHPLYVLSLLDGPPVFSTDDAYRYFIARSAWVNPHVYVWNYDLPLAVFLDGILVAFSHGSLFVARCLHLIPAFLTLYFVYSAGRILDIRRFYMSLSILVMAWMPVYAFVSLSFYGETWLTLLFAAAIWSYLRERFLLCAFLVSLMPMVRAEGVIIGAPIFLYFFFGKRYKEAAIILVPGLLHVVSIFLVFSNPMDYFRWRWMFRQGVPHDSIAGDFVYQFYILKSINPLWTLPGIVGLALSKTRKVLPFSLGGLLWGVALLLMILFQKSFYEPRYLLSALPLFALGWSALLEASAVKWPHSSGSISVLAGIVFAVIVADNLLQMDPLRAHFGDKRWPFGLSERVIYRQFPSYPPDELERRQAMVNRIYRIVDINKDVDALVVNDFMIFRHLDPHKIPGRVMVSLSPMSSIISMKYMSGQFYAMHPEGKQYSIYEFRTLDAFPDRVALYEGTLSCGVCVPVYRSGSYQLYAFSYDAKDKFDAH